MQLPQGHLELYRLFCTGHHTVRRSKKHSNGTPTDQSVEQTVMSFKGSRGLVGKGWSNAVMNLYYSRLWSITLHKVCGRRWLFTEESSMNKDLSFKQIADKYVSFVVSKYRCPTVIFDGYRVSSTKDHEHAKRCPIPLSRPVHITDEVRVPYTQEKYFILKENKANFVQFLSARLRTAGVDVIECDGDADCYI